MHNKAVSWMCLSSSSLKTLLVQDPQWAAPRLLQLPDNYNIIFQYYHRKACTACKKVPKDPALCLVCGAFVCLKGVCCKQQGICECVLVSALKAEPYCDYHCLCKWLTDHIFVTVLWSVFVKAYLMLVVYSTPNIVAQLQASFYW